MREIIYKYLDGTATEKEQLELLAWLRDKKNRLEFRNHSLVWKSEKGSGQITGIGEESWSKIQGRILNESYSGWQKSRKIQHFLRYAAILFFVVSLASLAYLFSVQKKDSQEYFTRVYSENGQISKIELPDGSLAWLNSGSEIKYNNFYASGNRNVQLIGEGYFQVVKNKDVPFIVKCGNIDVKVLGTHFNVDAYPDEDVISVVLEEGAVNLSSPENASFSYLMKPGELARFDKVNKELDVSEVNTVKFTSWKEGVINIYDQKLEDLAVRLELRYNQKFRIEKEVKDFTYTFTIKNESLDEIIDLMKIVTPIKVVQEKDVMVIKLDKAKANNTHMDIKN